MIHEIRRINIAKWSISNEFLSPISEELVRNDDEDWGSHRDLDLPPWPWSPTMTIPETPLPFWSLSSQSPSPSPSPPPSPPPPPPPSSIATKISDNTKIEIPGQKKKKKNHIYVKQTKRSMAASLFEFSRVSNFSKPWTFATTKHKKCTREREKDSKALGPRILERDEWRGREGMGNEEGGWMRKRRVGFFMFSLLDTFWQHSFCSDL